MNRENHDPWYVYVILTEKSRLYTGIARDPEKRFYEHLWDRKKGAKFFRSDCPQKIVFVQECDGKSQALKIESSLKKLSAKKKRMFIEEANTRFI